MTQPPMTTKGSDDFQTPPQALYPLLKYLDKDWIIWEPACGNKNLVTYLKLQGYVVTGTDIKTGHDFLNWEPTNEYGGYDCIITNPPYSLKQQFLKRCYELGKPFALLLPLTTFETQKRQQLFKKYGLQVIFFDKRINFETPSGNGGGSWFATAWFTNWLKLPQDFIFEHLTDPKQKRLWV